MLAALQEAVTQFKANEAGASLARVQAEFNLSSEDATAWFCGEEAIKHGMLELLSRHRMMVEGAAGLALAGLLESKAQWQGKRVVVIVCGGNISLEKLKGVIA